MTKETSNRNKDQGRGTGSSVMPDSLYDAFVSTAPEDVPKGVHFGDCFEAYAKAWRRGHVPRVHLGAPAEFSSQRTFYLSNTTLSTMREIAEADGVSTASVLRTAAAWSVSRSSYKGKDIWSAARFLTPTSD